MARDPVRFEQRENAELGLHQYGKRGIYSWSSGRHNGSAYHSQVKPLHFSFSIAAVVCGIALSWPMLAADFTVREYRSDDTLLGLPPYTFEGGKTLHLDGRDRQQRLPPSQRSAQCHLDDG